MIGTSDKLSHCPTGRFLHRHTLRVSSRLEDSLLIVGQTQNAASSVVGRVTWGSLGSVATYECSVCGMSVNATCGHCDAPLVNEVLERDDGSTVQVSQCPNDHGKIKSPLCCGTDMACTI